MIHRHLFILLTASLCFSGAFSRNNYFEHFFSKYHIHRSSSTTPSITSTPETVTTESISQFSQQGDIPSEEYDSSEDDDNDDNEPDFIANTTPFDSGARYRDPAQSAFVARVLTIVGSLVAVVVLLGCIVCCCPNCCRGTERRGFVTGTPISPQAEIIQTSQAPVIVQHRPPEYTQEPVQQFPPQYQQPVLPPSQYAPVHPQGYQYSPVQPQSVQYNQYSPVQPQTHYSPVSQGYPPASALQFYNPPEAPPPYEPTAPKM